MKKVLIPVLLAVISFVWVQMAEWSPAAPIPVLANVAKQRPQSGRKGNDGPVVIRSQAKANPLAPLKSAPEDSEAASGWLPDVSRKISSKSVIIIDAQTGEEIYAKSPDTPRQPASTIKVLTGMIALKSLDGADMVQVSRKASSMPRSKVNLDPKKTYRANDLINAVLLASANDASVALAEKIAGSETSFAEMMTLRARLWGAKNTVCRTASGLTAEGQQSTARDLAMIFRHAMQDDDFAERMGRVKVRTSYGAVLHSHNKALWRVNGAEGGKTGYTLAARQTYVGQFSHEEGTIVVALMGSETMWADVKNLVDYGFKKQKQQQVARRQLERTGRQLAMAE
ncbi:MAG: D-alanyl-D-alanine carboxypeptidase family protein [Desulfobulbaceae bacterium]